MLIVSDNHARTRITSKILSIIRYTCNQVQKYKVIYLLAIHVRDKDCIM